MSLVATWHLCSGLINDRASCGLALDLFLSSLAAFSFAPMTIHVHTLVPEMPGGALAPASLQEGFHPSIGCSGAAPLTAPSVVPSSFTPCPSSHPVLSSTSHHLPLHHASMDACLFSVPSCASIFCENGDFVLFPVHLWGWKTFLENSRCTNICKIRTLFERINFF